MPSLRRIEICVTGIRRYRCGRGLTREHVLGCAVQLLDLGFFRIGDERYAADNGSYGLATLRRRHLRVERGEAVFDFRAKGGKRHVQAVADPTVLPTLRALKRT